MKNIVLIGPKHCGKTSVGKALASLLFCDFIDLDEMITQNTGKTPRQLYIEGIEVFQQAEFDSLRRLEREPANQRFDGTRCASARDKFLIATGGGIADNQEAVELLKKIDAIKVYLSISAKTAWQRITASALADGELPPFLKTENPQETHRALHEHRAAAYLQLADVIIDAEGKTSDMIAAEITAAISNIL